MNDNTDVLSNYTRLAKYSMMLSVLGAVSYMLMFPSGIYYAFLCGVIGVSGGILTRKYSTNRGSCNAAVIVGIIDIIFSFLAFHGLNSLYSALRDPELGPQMSRFILEMLKQYGISSDTFVSIMNS